MFMQKYVDFHTVNSTDMFKTSTVVYDDSEGWRTLLILTLTKGSW